MCARCSSTSPATTCWSGSARSLTTLRSALLIHNVGGGGAYGQFVASSVDDVMSPVLANPVALTRLSHHFGRGMVARGRGGILVIGSMSGNAGSYNLATYSGAKAYNQIFVEALWAELEPKGVHVLAFPLGATDTPSRARYGTVDADETPVASSQDVARQALEQLPHGPRLCRAREPGVLRCTVRDAPARGRYSDARPDDARPNMT